MRRDKGHGPVWILLLALVLMMGTAPGEAQAQAPANLMVQCGGDTDGDGISDDPNIVCKHITAGDGFVNMADGKLQYTFGFSEVPPGTPDATVFADWQVKAELPGPLIVLEEGQELYLNLTNVGMINRPDLFDTHTVHFHGIPNSGSIFDGLPESAPQAKPGATFPYYYNTTGKAGTYFYHCHVEVVEHMQMGMIAPLYVKPAQDKAPPGCAGTLVGYAYNDGDCTTGYHREYALQLAGFDSNFHDQHIAVQNLPFATLLDDYHFINGRGYPDTINPSTSLGQSPENNNYASQKMPSLISATIGERVLLRVHNISTTHLFTIRAMGIPMKLVGTGAKHLRNGTKDLYQDASSLTIGGGQAYDIILETAGLAPGTYFFYVTNLDDLINGREERGGMMTEIVLN